MIEKFANGKHVAIDPRVGTDEPYLLQRRIHSMGPDALPCNSKVFRNSTTDFQGEID